MATQEKEKPKKESPKEEKPKEVVNRYVQKLNIVNNR
jgi:hypothetical protein